MASAPVKIVDTTRLERATGAVRASFKRRGAATRLDTLYQAGTGKLRFPRVAPGTPPEAILLNTGGGMTGGDRFSVDLALGPGATAVATTQACEKVYRALDGAARIENRIALGAGARLDWLPQETILFDGGVLTRSLDADIAEDAALLAVEAIVLGRTASGEAVEQGAIFDRIRVRRGGRLVLADAFRLEGAVSAATRRRALLGGGCAYALALLVAPAAEAMLDGARLALADSAGECGISAWNGMLVARFVSRDGRALRRDLVTFLGHVRSCAIPRVWTC